MAEVRRIGGTSSSVKPTVYPGDEFYESDTGEINRFDGDSYHRAGSAGVPAVGDGFRPSSYNADLTMDGTAQSVALASGATRIRVTNRGATTEAVRVAFGTSAANAESNLNIAAAAATTGLYIGAAADFHNPVVILGVPTNATHYAVANAVASDTQVVSVEQGV